MNACNDAQMHLYLEEDLSEGGECSRALTLNSLENFRL